jgi:transposase
MDLRWRRIQEPVSIGRTRFGSFASVVRLVREGEAAYGSEWEAICAVAEMLGPTAETVRKWVRRAEVDAGERPGLKTEERERLKQLERENFELRRANEILRSASRFFATELDGRRRT